MIVDATNKFYFLIPHYFDGQKIHLLDKLEIIEEKIKMLDSLTEIERTINLLKARNESDAENANSEKDAIDYHYEKLNCDIDVLEKETDEFKLLHNYISNTHSKEHSSYTLEVKDIFKIKRNDESFKKMQNRKLLFHGSRSTNFANILSQGLKIAPGEAPPSGYMFGKVNKT